MDYFIGKFWSIHGNSWFWLVLFGDKDVDMQKLAKHLWKAKAQKYGIKLGKNKN
ncbi:MAG: hypothetical protein JKX67_01255 [Colwellia sp.]|nr:hypothetical protein [Colwellia sp.]